jgi:predicted DNA-binding protein (MmcQ/YjbR family)
MSRAFVIEFCAGLPAAEWSEPFGPGTDVWKLGGKIFAAIGERAEGVSVKCPDVETAEMLRAAGVAKKAPYFHKSWVMVPFTAGEDELDHRLRVSYETIRTSLPKKVQAGLTQIT